MSFNNRFKLNPLHAAMATILLTTTACAVPGGSTYNSPEVVAVAKSNPCNPCAAKVATNPCNPCNPCGAKVAAKANPCNPCNPCAAKVASNPCNPCNPCAAKVATNPCNPCNPCAAKVASNPCNPCNPCGAKVAAKANPCNPCNPCAAKVASNPCNPCNPCAAKVAANSASRSGAFTGLSNHETLGSVTLVKTVSGYVVELGDDFSFDGAPDPKVALGKDGEYDPATLIEVLQSNSGAQSYEVPESINASDYNEVYIWCEKFSVGLGVASIK